MSLVLTIGTFDLLHVGHLELLAACREMAGEDGTVVVAVNRDAFVERFKGRRPVVPLEQRMVMLSALRSVDEVFENIGDEYAMPAILNVMPDILAIGDDWQKRDYLGQLHLPVGWLESQRIELVYVPRTTGVSTTDLRSR